MKAIDVTLQIFGVELPVSELELREALDTPTRARVGVRATAELDPGAGLDQTAALVFSRGGVPHRTETLRLFAVRYVGVEDGVHAYELDLRASLDFLRLSTDVKKFRDMSADAIVSSIYDKHGVRHRFELASPLPSLPNTIQYRETSLDFTNRLMEHEGVHYAIEDDVVVLSDASGAAPPVEGKSAFGLEESDGALAAAEDTITSWRRGTRIGTGRATVSDYDWKEPTKSLLASERGTRDAQLEVYEYLTGHRDLARGQKLARIKIEAFEAMKRFAEGTSDVVDFRPRRVFDFAHTDGIDHSGSWLLVSVTHVFVREGARGARAKYENSFVAIPREVPYRPAEDTPKPEISGTHTAMVRGPIGEEIHTDVYGRFKAQFHYDRDAKGTDEDSRWLRMLQETSSSMGLARVGWEVNVGYIGGDPDRPIGLSRMINGQMVPTYAQPSQQNVMTIKTESYPGKAGNNELRIDDTAGAQQIFVHAQHGMQNFVKHDQIERIGRDESHEVKLALSRNVLRNQRMTVGKDQTVVVAAGDTLAVGGDRKKTVGGDETVTIGGALSATVEQNDAERVSSLRFSLVGGIKPPEVKSLLPDPKSLVPDPKAVLGNAKNAAMGAIQGGASPGGVAAAVKGSLPNPAAQLKAALPTPANLSAKLKGALDPSNLIDGRIERSSDLVFSRVVGGAHAMLAGGNITRRGTYLLAETVGLLKLSKTIEESVLQVVSGKFVRTVLGSVTRRAGTDIGSTASTSDVTIGGAATMKTDEHVDFVSRTITMKAKEKLELVVGDVKLELTPTSATVVGKLKVETKGSLVVRGGPDDVTK
ncbi:MAG TPA: type VI secretion system tip protein TssI/VgrG [Polyangiaceae bacterium]|nr:type VI secretion system tip protein TssI/VgrG [Polyangiaceae bacterium]